MRIKMKFIIIELPNMNMVNILYSFNLYQLVLNVINFQILGSK